MHPTVTSMLRRQMAYLKKKDFKGYHKMCAMLLATEGGAPETTFKQTFFVYGKNN